MSTQTAKSKFLSLSFQPFSVHESAALRASYEEDLVWVEKNYPDILINLPSQE